MKPNVNDISDTLNHTQAGESDNIKYKYEGERNEKGDRHGYGNAILDNGDNYSGEYKLGKRDGYGVYIFKDKGGAKYTGHYRDNVKSGSGIFEYPDGGRYEGDWKNDKRHGRGSYKYPNGDRYEGDWHNDVRHGKGLYTYAGEDMKYDGMWRHGKRSGEGKLLFNENYFEGHFRHDNMLGPGRYVFRGGHEQYGEYVLEQNDPIKDENSNNLLSHDDEFITKWRSKNIQGYIM